MPRVQVRQWWELHINSKLEDGKTVGAVCHTNGRTIEYDRKKAHEVKRKYRKGFASVVRVTRYRVLKEKPIGHHKKCFLFHYGAGPGVCDCQTERFKKKWAGRA